MQSLKLAHLFFVSLSIAGFILRAGWLFLRNPRLQSRWVKISPHIIDTGLFISGIWLIFQTRQYPFVYPWISLKLLLVIIYILCGMMMFKAKIASKQKLFFALSVALLSSIIALATLKPLLW